MEVHADRYDKYTYYNNIITVSYNTNQPDCFDIPYYTFFGCLHERH